MQSRTRPHPPGDIGTQGSNGAPAVRGVVQPLSGISLTQWIDCAIVQIHLAKPSSRHSIYACHTGQTRDGAVWQLVGLITRRSQVQILLPQPVEEGHSLRVAFFLARSESLASCSEFHLGDTCRCPRGWKGVFHQDPPNGQSVTNSWKSQSAQWLMRPVPAFSTTLFTFIVDITTSATGFAVGGHAFRKVNCLTNLWKCLSDQGLIEVFRRLSTGLFTFIVDKR